MSFNQSDWVLSVLRKSESSLVLTRRMMSGKHLQLLLQFRSHILTSTPANSSFEEKCSQRVKARSHTPKLPRFNDSSHHNVSSTSDTELRSSVEEQRLRRMQQMNTLSCLPSVCMRSVKRGPN